LSGRMFRWNPMTA
jgi:hypothetical protein